MKRTDLNGNPAQCVIAVLVNLVASKMSALSPLMPHMREAPCVSARPQNRKALGSALYTFKCYRSRPVCKGAERGGRVGRPPPHFGAKIAGDDSGSDVARTAGNGATGVAGRSCHV